MGIAVDTHAVEAEADRSIVVAELAQAADKHRGMEADNPASAATFHILSTPFSTSPLSSV